MTHSVDVDINGHPLKLETGKVAKQADGAVIVRHGETMVLATCVAAKSATEGQDFFPLTVEYRERAYAGGRIPGGYFKREGRPVEKEILTSRLIDRPIRPLFPKGFKNEVQVICLAVSADQENDPDVLALNGASAALCLAGIPFGGPVGAVRVGMVEGKLIANPTTAEQVLSSLELVIAGTEDAVLMVESGAKEVSEETMLEAITFGHRECQRLVRAQKELVQRAGKPRWAFDPDAGRDAGLETQVRRLVGDQLLEIFTTVHEKQARADAVSKLFDEVCQAVDADDTKKRAVREAFEAVESAAARPLILEIGHGALAERAVAAILPAKEEFPYTIRIVSDILESNGSSSMATVCGASLALMDAGVPLKSHVAGIAMGLVKEGEKFGILTDIMGTEDHYGDMDFKVAGTEKGITALQMDIKIAGVSVDIMRAALQQARDARLFVLTRMREAIEKPRPELSPYAPRFVTIKIRTEK